MTATFEAARAFIESAPGQRFDIDKMYKFQCKDLIDAYCMALWGDWKNTIRPGNANECYAGANPTFFDKIPNVLGDLTNYPQYGDIVISKGDKFNPYGHIWICTNADPYIMDVIHQNVDGLATSPTERGRLGYDQLGTGPVIGWLRPKLSGSIMPDSTGPVGVMVGIDISGHQKGINVGPTGAQFAFTKATEGVGWTDPELRNNLASIRAAGIPAGFYHFARPGATADNTPDAEAQTFINAVKDIIQASDAICLDWESDNIKDVGWASRFLDLASSALGRRCVIYMNASAINGADWSSVEFTYPLWYARYGTNAPTIGWNPPTGKPDATWGAGVALWQYTSTGHLPGYGGDLDLNVCLGGPAVWATLTANGTAPVVVASTPPTPAPAPAPARNHGGGPLWWDVDPGDTMGGIAAAVGVSLQALIAANPGVANPNVITPGQRLTLPDGARWPAAQAAPAPTGGPIWWIVDPGDTMSAIAAKSGVTLGSLIAANPGVNPNLIYPGQRLNLPAGAHW